MYAKIIAALAAGLDRATAGLERATAGFDRATAGLERATAGLERALAEEKTADHSDSGGDSGALYLLIGFFVVVFFLCL